MHLRSKKHWDALEIKEAPSVLKQWRHNWGSLHLTHQHLQLYISNYLSPIYVHTIACPSLKKKLLYTSVGLSWLAALGSHQVSTYTQVTLFLFPNTIILWVVLMMDRVHVQSFKEIRLKNRVYTPSQPYYDDGEHVELLLLALINFSDVCCVYQWPFVTPGIDGNPPISFPIINSRQSGANEGMKTWNEVCMQAKPFPTCKWALIIERLYNACWKDYNPLCS